MFFSRTCKSDLICVVSIRRASEQVTQRAWRRVDEKGSRLCEPAVPLSCFGRQHWRKLLKRLKREVGNARNLMSIAAACTPPVSFRPLASFASWIVGWFPTCPCVGPCVLSLLLVPTASASSPCRPCNPSTVALCCSMVKFTLYYVTLTLCLSRRYVTRAPA